MRRCAKGGKTRHGDCVLRQRNQDYDHHKHDDVESSQHNNFQSRQPCPLQLTALRTSRIAFLWRPGPKIPRLSRFLPQCSPHWAGQSRFIWRSFARPICGHKPWRISPIGGKRRGGAASTRRTSVLFDGNAVISDGLFHHPPRENSPSDGCGGFDRVCGSPCAILFLGTHFAKVANHT